MEFAKKCRSQLLIMFCCLLDQSIQPDALLAANENIWKSTSNKFVRGSHWDSATAANRLHLRTAKLYVFEGTQKDLVEVFANPVDAEKFYCAFIPTDKNLFQQITMFYEFSYGLGTSPKIFADYLNTEILKQAFQQALPAAKNVQLASLKQPLEENFQGLGSITAIKVINQRQNQLAYQTSAVAETFQNILQVLQDVTTENSTMGTMFAWEKNINHKSINSKYLTIGINVPFLFKVSHFGINGETSHARLDEFFDRIVEATQLTTPVTLYPQYIFQLANWTRPSVSAKFGDLRFYATGNFYNHSTSTDYHLALGTEMFLPPQTEKCYIPEALNEEVCELSLSKVSADAAKLYINPQNSTACTNVINDCIPLMENILATLHQTHLNTQCDLARSGIGCYARPSILFNNGKVELFANIRGSYLRGTEQVKVFPMTHCLGNCALIAQLSPIAAFQFDAGFTLRFKGIEICCGYDFYFRSKEFIKDFTTESTPRNPEQQLFFKESHNITASTLHQHSVFSNITLTSPYATSALSVALGCHYNFGMKEKIGNSRIGTSWGLSTSIISSF